MCQQKLGQHFEAVQTFTEILREVPGMRQALVLRARSQVKLEKPEAALVDLLVVAVLEGGDQNSPTIQAVYKQIVDKRLADLQQVCFVCLFVCLVG